MHEHYLCEVRWNWYFDSLWILKIAACPIIVNLPLGREVHLAMFTPLVNRGDVLNSAASFYASFLH